jgi:hypothetical protein
MHQSLSRSVRRSLLQRRISLELVHLRCAGLSIGFSSTVFLLQIKGPENRKKVMTVQDIAEKIRNSGSGTPLDERRGATSVAAIGKHPIHPMLIPFPVAF